MIGRALPIVLCRYVLLRGSKLFRSYPAWKQHTHGMCLCVCVFCGRARHSLLLLLHVNRLLPSFSVIVLVTTFTTGDTFLRDWKQRSTAAVLFVIQACLNSVTFSGSNIVSDAPHNVTIKNYCCRANYNKYSKGLPPTRESGDGGGVLLMER